MERFAMRAGMLLVAWWGCLASAAAQPAVEELANDPPRFLDVARKAFKWDEPAEPARIVGPIYFVGTKGLSAFLIATPEGHIVLNTGMPGSGPLIEKSIRKLGFQPQDVKLLLTGHAHVDHVGGHAYLQKLSMAKIAMIREEKDLFESGGKLDFHYGGYPEFEFEPAKVDRTFRDGEEIKLGDVTLRALLTNGHTRGSTTFVMKVLDDGKTYSVVFPNGTSINPGYRLTKNPSYPGIADDYRRTLRILAALEPDIWLLPHNEAYGFDGKLAHAAQEGAKAWVDPTGYRNWVVAQRQKFDATLDKENAGGAAAARSSDKPIPVNVQNFARAETDRYFGRMLPDVGGIGRFGGPPEFTPIDHQAIVRMNRDTLYSAGIFDLDAAPVTITLPEAGKRFMSLQVINEDHYTLEVVYAPGRHTYTKDRVGTRYVILAVRTLADPNDPRNIQAANMLRDAIKVEQARSGKWESPNWDQQSLTKAREALAALGSLGGDTSGAMFGSKAEVDPVLHLIGTAVGWGGNPRSAAIYSLVYPAANDGKTAYALTVKDVPVDGFWSINVYNAQGFFEKNDRNLYSLNNLTAKPNPDGSLTIRFGGSPEAANYLPITPGWNYTVRLYRPRQEILDGAWKFPEAQPVQ